MATGTFPILVSCLLQARLLRALRYKSLGTHAPLRLTKQRPPLLSGQSTVLYGMPIFSPGKHMFLSIDSSSEVQRTCRSQCCCMHHGVLVL